MKFLLLLTLAVITFSGCASLPKFGPSLAFTKAEKIEGGLVLHFISKGETEHSKEFVDAAVWLGQRHLALNSVSNYIIFGAKGDGDRWSNTNLLPYNGSTFKSRGGPLIIDGQEGMITVYPNPSHSRTAPIVLHEDVALESGARSVEIGMITLSGREWPLMAELSESSFHIID